MEIQIISYNENQLVLFLSESCFSYALEIMSRTLFDCVSGKEEYGILIDYKYVHITKASYLKQEKSPDEVILKTLSDESIIIYPNAEEKEAIPFS